MRKRNKRVEHGRRAPDYTGERDKKRQRKPRYKGVFWYR